MGETKRMNEVPEAFSTDEHSDEHSVAGRVTAGLPDSDRGTPLYYAGAAAALAHMRCSDNTIYPHERVT